MVMLLILMFSRMPPSTSSSAKPRQERNTQFATVTLRKPPLASVPNLRRPFPLPFAFGFIVPSSKVPTSKPDTMQFTMVIFSVMTLRPSANELFGQRPSSLGELMRQLETITLAAIDVNAVPVGVHGDIINGKVVAAS